MSMFNPHMSVLEANFQVAPPKTPQKPSHPASLQPGSIVLSPNNKLHPGAAPVSENIYGGFLEHLGRCIYGGIVDDPKDPSPKDVLVPQDETAGVRKGRLGFRKDVIQVLGKGGELEVPMLRWPGGNFVSNYHWQDGIGPIEDRPERIELAWHNTESNLFGTDEYIEYCRAVGCEPYICLNMGTGSYEEALAWLEYCNGTGNTAWAKLRRKNTGRDEPHNVKYWGLGNEMFGPWQIGYLKPTEYARKAKMWAHGLKLVDPSITLVSCGCTGGTDWDREIIQTLIPWADMHSIHGYTMFGHNPDFAFEENVFGPAAQERQIEICKGLIDLANIDRHAQKMPGQDMKIAFDEWNIWDEKKGTSANGLAQTYDYSDMLGMCAWLNVLVRKHKDLGLACLAQTVNVISPVTTSANGVLRQTTFYPLQLFSKYMKGGQLLQLPVFADYYDGPLSPSYVQEGKYHPSYIDAVAMIATSATGASIRLSLLNRHPTADWTTSISFAGFNVKSVTLHEMTSDDLHAVNTFEQPENVVPVISKFSADEWTGKIKDGFVVKKHSWAFLVLDGSAA